MNLNKISPLVAGLSEATVKSRYQLITILSLRAAMLEMIATNQPK